MIDVTPLEFEEVEFIEQDFSILLENCDSPLQYEVDCIIEEVIGSLNSAILFNQAPFESIVLAQKDIDTALEIFNRDKLQFYTKGILAKAEVKVQLCKTANIVGYQAWVEYTGLTQYQTDLLPPHIRRKIYEKYLSGWSDLREKTTESYQIIADAIKQATKSFKGKKISAFTLDKMKEAIHHALLTTNLVDSVETSMNHQGSMLIRTGVTNRTGKHQYLDTTISF